MRIETCTHEVYILTTSTLRESKKKTLVPYSLRLVDLNPVAVYSHVPYERKGSVSFYHDGRFRADVYVTREQGRVTRIAIGCQTFLGKNARAIVKAAKLARQKSKK